MSSRPAPSAGSGWHGMVDAVMEPSRVARDLRELTKAHRQSLAEHRKELRRHRRAKRFKLRSKDFPPAPVGPKIPEPPQRLRVGAAGAAEVTRLIRAQRQLLTVVPQLEKLSTAAAAELRHATTVAAPVLKAQVDRLAVLDDVIRRVRSGDAARTARESAEVIRTRLRAGVEAYERLAQAAIAMLAAPDLGDAADEVLAPAALGLSSYAHGMEHSAKALGR